MSAKQTQKQSAESNPWAPAQQGLESILNRANTLGRRTEMFRPVQGAATQGALGQMTSLAGQGSAALPIVQDVAQGSAQGFNTGLGTLQATARGDNLGTVNPFLQSALDRASQNTANTVNQQFSAAGRYGSANHAGTIADRVGQLQTQALVNNYNQEREAQLQAASQLQGGGYQGAALAPQIDESRLFGANLLGQVGAQQDAFEMARRQAPLEALRFQSGLTVPIAGLGGTQSSTTTNRTNNPMGTAIGALTTGMGLLSGGGGGGLFSMFTGGR